MTRRLLCCLMAALLGLPAPGAERLLQLDPAASEIRFTLDATMHEVQGSFNLSEGEIRFDAETGTIENPFLRWVFYTPWATPESTGLPTAPTGPGAPWLMFPGTAGAHIMITPPLPDTGNGAR